MASPICRYGDESKCNRAIYLAPTICPIVNTLKDFKENIYIDNKTVSLTFYLIHTVKGETFFIKGAKDNMSFAFDMRKNNYGKWEIIEPTPQWVKEIENELIDIVNRNY